MTRTLQTTGLLRRALAPVARPSVLAVTSELPWPLDTGGHLRTFHLLRALARHFQVRLVTAVTSLQEDALAALRSAGISLYPAVVGPRVLWREALRAAAAAVRGEPYVLYRRHDRREVRRLLCAEFARLRPDAVYLDHLDSLVFEDLFPRTPLVLDLHNVYSTLAERAAEEQPTRWRRLYLRREARLLERMEGRSAGAARALLAVSEEDARHFAAFGPKALHVVPNGVDCSAYAGLPAGRDARRPTLLYVGAMSWGPNVSAAQFLAREVLPEVRRRLPAARLRIVGRDPTADVCALRCLPGVEVTGGVPDVLPHLREAHLLAVPLEAGGGTRLKILEAFAAGLPVVSTPVGCEGLRVSHGQHLLIARREEFAEAVLSVLGDSARGLRLAEQARTLVRQQYDWSRVGDLACQAVAAALEDHPRPTAPFALEELR